jgi:peptide/nickel transport system ATP-binding protein
VRAVDGLSFDLARGQTVAMVGESGCGKTTAGRAILRLVEPDAGHVYFRGHDLPAAPPETLRALRRHMQIIFQDPFSSLNPRQTIAQIVGRPLQLHGLAATEAEAEAQVKALMEKVGLQASYSTRYPHEFSGGQRQRIGIARAVALRPDFIVCDEAVSALDVSVQAQVLNIMKDLQRERGLTYLFISHNLAVVRHVSDQVGVMYLGRLVELADKHTLFGNPQHPYTKMLLDAIPKMHDTGRARTPVQGEVPNPLNPPSGCTFHPRCPQATDICRAERPALRDFKGIKIACHAVV